jgi:hypothetical protein
MIFFAALAGFKSSEFAGQCAAQREPPGLKEMEDSL